jgi:predicted small secreted protein
MKRTARTVSLFLLVTVAAVAVAGCNTVEGAGRDLSAAGDGISKAADDTGKAISGEK